MQNNYSIIPPFELYPISTKLSIITGTPFLYFKAQKTVIIGDIHLGHESALFGTDSNHISSSCKHLTDSLLQMKRKFDYNRIICNGDIKHHTNSIKIQELEELKYFTTELLNEDLKIDFLKGNHDELLEFVFPHIDLESVELKSKYLLDKILITHGHNLEKFNNTWSEVILSHEHPAYTLYGHNRARIKLPAFATLRVQGRQAYILPAANSISTGTNYPPRSNDQFISPILKKFGIIESIELFPFDEELGLLELPPVSQWKR